MTWQRIGSPITVSLVLLMLGCFLNDVKAQSAAEKCETETGDVAIAACNEAIKKDPGQIVANYQNGELQSHSQELFVWGPDCVKTLTGALTT